MEAIIEMLTNRERQNFKALLLAAVSKGIPAEEILDTLTRKIEKETGELKQIAVANAKVLAEPPCPSCPSGRLVQSSIGKEENIDILYCRDCHYSEVI